MIQSSADNSILHQKLADTFKRTVDFLNTNNFTWWVAYGTAIGAVRHEGIIPWDDDIDIFMPWKDYCRLLKFDQNKLKECGLSLDIPFEKNNICPYIKFYDTNSTVWQVKQYESVIGLWIDVFPLFETNADVEKYWKYVKQYKSLSSKYIEGKRIFYLSDLWYFISHFRIRTLKNYILHQTIDKLLLTQNIKKFRKFLEGINYEGGANYMFPFTYFKAVNLFPREWFESSVEVPFEDFTVKINNGYDALLRQLYGDYMIPPTESKRQSTHAFYFLDIENAYTASEVKHIMSKQ